MFNNNENPVSVNGCLLRLNDLLGYKFVFKVVQYTAVQCQHMHPNHYSTALIRLLLSKSTVPLNVGQLGLLSQPL